MGERKFIDVALVRQLLDYNPETGALRWKVSRGRVKAGSIAGCYNTELGYVLIGINGRLYRAHRLAFAIMTGEVPHEVDHRDGDAANNRWLNLRSCTKPQNNGNSRKRSGTKARLKGVSYEPRTGRWYARLGIGPKRYLHLGTHDTEEAAHAAYASAAKQHFGDFARIA